MLQSQDWHRHDEPGRTRDHGFVPSNHNQLIFLCMCFIYSLIDVLIGRAMCSRVAEGVHDFLLRLFSDRDIIQLPMQKYDEYDIYTAATISS